jgi:hypothetical protein
MERNYFSGDTQMSSRLELLRKSILDMTDEEKFDMLRAVRADRKQSKAPVVRERKVKKDGDKMVKIMDSMTPEARAALLASLLGESNG